MQMFDPTARVLDRAQSESDGSFEVVPEKIFDVAGIARCWSLSEGEQRDLLGGVPADVFDRWRLGVFDGFTADTAQRIGLIFEIFHLLQAAFPASETADGWIRKPNYDLHGRVPLAIMLEGLDGLERVRGHLQGHLADA